MFEFGLLLSSTIGRGPESKSRRSASETKQWRSIISTEFAIIANGLSSLYFLRRSRSTASGDDGIAGEMKSADAFDGDNPLL